MVLVVGVYRPTDEGEWISEPACDANLETEGYVWNHIISIENAGRLGTKLGELRKDRRWIAKLREIVSRMPGDSSSRNPQRFLVGFGRLETRALLQVVYGKQPYGYGHLNGAPAQITFRDGDSWVFTRDELMRRR
jgi:hypothetical protein